MSTRFTDVLALDELGGDRFRSADSQVPEFLLGGKALGAASLAAGRTVPDDFALLSFGTWFVGRRDTSAPVEFQVRRIRDGRSFANREVDGVGPDGALWFRSQAIYHLPESGVDQQVDPPAITPVDDLTETPLGVWVGPDLPRNSYRAGADEDYELRFDRAAPDTTHRWWARTRQPIGDDRRGHEAAVVYATDLRGGSPALHITGWPEVRQFATTLDHSVWLHRPLCLDEWVQLECHSEITAGSRGFVTGTMYDASSKRVASYAQTILVRASNES